MLGVISYAVFLGLLGLVMLMISSSGRDLAGANATAAMLSARLH